MKKIFKTKIIPLTLVILILFGSTIYTCSKLFEDKLAATSFLERQNVREFYSLEENSVDVLALGSSQILSAFSAPELYANYGITSFGLGTCQQNFFGSYYWLLEILKTQSPKVVLLEMAGLVREATSSSYYRTFVEMKNTSKYKLQAAWELSHNRDYGLSLLEFYSPFYEFHSRWDKLNTNDYDFMFGKEKRTYLGSCVNAELYEEPKPIEELYVKKTDISDIYANGEYLTNNNTEDENSDTENDEVDFDTENIVYLKKIIELCRDKGIELVLYKAPRYVWNDTNYSIACTIAEENGLTYIDFNEKKQIDFDIYSDMGDHGHSNIFGAIKITRYLGQYLKDTYDLEDRRADDRYSYYEYTYNEYKKELVNVELRQADNISDVLDSLGKYDYSIVISKIGDINWNDELQKKLEKIGFKSDLTGDGSASLVKGNGKIILDLTADGVIAKNGYFKEGMANFRAYADPYQKSVTVRIAGKSKTCYEESCIVIAAYDTEQKRVVCSSQFGSDHKLIVESD